MKAVLSRMLSIGAPVSVEEDDVEFLFVMEYGGPPVSYNLPRAAPIDIKRIPTAAVVAPASLSGRVSLLVVQPLLSSDPLKKKLSEDLTHGSEADVSPGSCNGSLRNREASGEVVEEDRGDSPSPSEAGLCWTGTIGSIVGEEEMGSVIGRGRTTGGPESLEGKIH
ncbi:hypothetical protein NE237_000244 [Protea cynaroides]|uniref:Uncharacterized protein n=1 Tax=Protea cynaroides TaxID=273540 RepID=A0A9Q0KQR7_9MAGN|nr:hypothetical protein NE237_000244 [Protea cynaroides]